MDSQMIKIVLMTTIPPWTTVSLADCTLRLVVFRTLNHFLLIPRSNREISILYDYPQNCEKRFYFWRMSTMCPDSRCYITTNWTLNIKLLLNSFHNFTAALMRAPLCKIEKLSGAITRSETEDSERHRLVHPASPDDKTPSISKLYRYQQGVFASPQCSGDLKGYVWMNVNTMREPHRHTARSYRYRTFPHWVFWFSSFLKRNSLYRWR